MQVNFLTWVCDNQPCSVGKDWQGSSLSHLGCLLRKHQEVRETDLLISVSTWGTTRERDTLGRGGCEPLSGCVAAADGDDGSEDDDDGAGDVTAMLEVVWEVILTVRVMAMMALVEAIALRMMMVLWMMVWVEVMVLRMMMMAVVVV